MRPDRYTIELYDANGAIVSSCGVETPMEGFAMLAKREGLDYVTATCWHYYGNTVEARWELEIK